MKQTIMVGLALLAIIWTPTNVLSQDYLFHCPEVRGLCYWSERGGWSTFWENTHGGTIVEFWTANDGRVLLQLSGHQNPGVLLLLSLDGRVSLVRDIEASRSLNALSGADAEGNVILCNATNKSARCDTWLPTKADDMMHAGFPPSCLFPRADAAGRESCLERTGLNVTVMVRKSDDTVFRSSLTLSNLLDLQRVVVYQDCLLLLADDSLYIIRGTSVDKLISGGVSRLWLLGENVLIQTREYCDASRSVSYSLTLMNSDLKLTPLSTERSEYLQNAYWSPAGIVADAIDGTKRRITLLVPNGGAMTERVLWTGNVPMWSLNNRERD